MLDGNLTSVRFESLVGVEVIMDPLPVSSTCLPNAYDGVLAHIEVCSTNQLVFLLTEIIGSPRDLSRSDLSLTTLVCGRFWYNVGVASTACDASKQRLHDYLHLFNYLLEAQGM